MKTTVAAALASGVALGLGCGARSELDFAGGGAGGGQGNGGDGGAVATSSASGSSQASSSASSSSSSSSSTAASTSSVASSGTGGCTASPEACNGIDDDCDAIVDEADAIGCQLWYRDDDGDGWGRSDDALCLCAPSGAYDAAQPGDCDDSSASVHPGAFELCNGVDDDCNGVIDDGLGLCDCPSLSFGGKTYLLCTDAKSWFDASAHCATVGYSLTSIGTDAEDAWLFDQINQLSGGDKWWMGMNDLANEGVWVWEDGSPVTYTNWEPGEPNDSGGEDCAQLNRFFPADTWNDEPCDFPLPFVCESP